MNVIRLAVGQLQANCFLLVNEPKSETIIIDPGEDADLITDRIREEGGIPLAVLLTHGHFDHVMAASDVQLTYNIPVYLHSQDQFLLDRLPETVQHFLGWKTAPLPPSPVAYYDLKSWGQLRPEEQRQQLEVGPFKFNLLDLPGHTPGSVGLYLSSEQRLFCGDVMFAEGSYGRTDFSYSNRNDLMRSIKTILQLPEETIIDTGHGESTTVGREKQFWENQGQASSFGGG